MPTSDIFTGLNDTDILAMQQDTQTRLNDIFSNNPKQFTNPEGITQPEAPKGLYGTVNPGENINLDKTSFDYNAAAYNSLTRKTAQTYPDSFKQLPDILLPQSETRRYTGQDFGFDITRDNEDLYNSKQNAGLEFFGKSLFGRLPLLAISKLGTGVGYLLGLANPENWFEKNYISSATDNSFAKFFEGMEDKVKNDWLPIYQKASARDMGFFERAFKDQTFWSGDIVDAAAFMASAFVPGLAVSKLGLGAKLATLAGMTEGEALTASAEYLSNAGLKLARNTDIGLTTALNTASESMFEAKQVRDDVYKKLMSTGQYTDQEAQKIAGDKARNSFLSNIAALSASNLWESNLIFKALGKKGEAEGVKLAENSLLDEYVESSPTTKLGKILDGKIGFYGKKALEGIGVEGFYEENIQQAIQQYNENNKNNNDGFLKYSAGVIGQMWNQTKDALSGKDKDTAMNIGVGALIGGLFGTATNIIGKEYSENKANAKVALDALNQVRNNWLKIQDIYSVDPETGKIKTDYGKAAAILFTQAANADRLNSIQKAEDPINREIAQKQLFSSLVASHLNNDSFNKLITQLDQMKNWKPEDLVKLGFDTDRKGVNEKIEEYKRFAENVKDLKEVVDKTKAFPKETRALYEYRKNKLFELGTTRDALVQEQNKLDTKIANLESKIGNSDVTDNFVNEANTLKLKIAYQEMAITEANENTIQLAEKRLKKYKDTLNELLKNNEETLKDLKSDREGYLIYRDDQKNKHPLVSELHNSIVKRATVNNAIDDVSDEFIAYSHTKEHSEDKYKQDIDDFQQYLKEAQEKNKEEVEQEQPEADTQSVSTNQAPQGETKTSQTTQQAAPVQTPSTSTPEVKPTVTPEQQKGIDLLNKRNEDLKNATTNEEKKAINDKYIKDALALANENKKNIVASIDNKKANEIKNLIPKGNTIHKDELSKLFNIVSEAASKGLITPAQEEELINLLNSKKVVGTQFNTEADLEDESADKTPEEEKQENDPDLQPDDNEFEDTELNQSPSETDKDYNPDTSNVDTTELDNSDLSALAFMTSNKTVTQEEKQDDNGFYNNTLDEDPYKQFIQGYLRYLQQSGLPSEGIHGKIIKDNNSLPHSEDTKKTLSNGQPYGSVLVITDADRNILYFDDNYNSSYNNIEGSKPIVFSFTSQYWDDLKNMRAVLGQERTGISMEDFLKTYEKEKEQQQLARQLNDIGKEVKVEVKAISQGVIRKSKTPVKSSDVIKEDMSPNLYIPSSVDKYDPENPDATKFVLVGNKALLNGGLYAEVIDKKNNYISYVRLIPNLISDIPELFESIKTLLNHTYDNKNEATLVRDYLKQILFLGKPKRPTLIVTENEEQDQFNIKLIQDRVMIDPEATIDFITKQRLNIIRPNIENDEYSELTIKNGKIATEIKPDYKNYILNNSTTVDIPVQTSEGGSFLPLNNYAMFNFLDSLETMKSELSNEEKPAEETSIGFAENETPVFRHGQNNEDISQRNSGRNNIPLNDKGKEQAQSIGRILKSLGIKNIITSSILRSIQTGQIAAKIANITGISHNDLFDTWDIGDFTSEPNELFDERWFVAHPDDDTKDGKKLGETFNSFRIRMEKAYKFIAEQTDNQTAIIAHSRDIRMWTAIKQNNGYWNQNALEAYLNQTEGFDQTSVPRVEEAKKDNSTLTKNPLKRLSKAPQKSVEELAREQDEKDKNKLLGESNQPGKYKNLLNKLDSFLKLTNPTIQQTEALGNEFLANPKITNALPQEWLKSQRSDISDAYWFMSNIAGRGELKTVLNTLIKSEESGLNAIVDKRENLPLLEQSEINHANSLFGYEVMNRVNDIVNSNVRATWTTSGIKLYRDARKGDGYHEAWHHFSQLYLTTKEKRSLYDEARKKDVDFTTRDGRKLNSKTASDFDIEEFMADDFRDYVLSDGKSRLVEKPYRNNIFRRILDFLKKFFFGDINIDKLYSDLYQGNLNSYTPSINNAMWGKLNSKAVDKNGNEIVDNQKAAYYRDLIDYHMGEQLLAANTSVEALRKNKQLAEAIYTNIYNDLLDRYYTPMLDKADAGEEINQQVAEDLFKILSNWEAFVSYHKKASKLFLNIQHELVIDVPENPEDKTQDDDLGGDNYEIKEDEDEEFGNESVDKNIVQSDKLYDVAGNEQSSIQAASVQTRGLIRMLPAIDYDGGKFTVKLDVNGFPRLNDYARTWNNIAYELSDISSYDEMIQKLRQPDVLKKIPEVSALLKHLPDPSKSHTPAEINTILAFRTDFNRAYIGIYSGKMYPGGRYYLNEETKRNRDQVMKVWTANFYNKLSTDPDIIGGNILLDEETGKYYLNPGVVLTYNMATLEGREKFMSLIGMSFADEAKKNRFYITGLPNFLREIQNNINLRHKNGLKIYNPIFDVRFDYKDKQTNEILIKGMTGVINGLINYQAQYAADVPSLSYQTAEGEMIYGLSLNHSLSIITNKLNRAKSYDDIKNDPSMQHLNFLNNPYVKGSIFLNGMFNLNNGARITNNKIVLGNYNGFKQEDNEGNTVGFSTTSLNVRQKAIFDISSLLSKGVIEVMRTESSKSAFFIKLQYYDKKTADPSSTYLPISFSELPAGFQSPKLMHYMIDYYLNDELNRMKNASDVPIFKENADLMKAAQSFDLFRDILRSADKDPETLKNGIKSDLEALSVENVIDKYRPKIEQAIVNFFTRELNSFKETLAEENITANDLPRDLPSKSYDQQLRTFIVNDFILNVEYAKIFNGDTIYRTQYKDYFKRSKGDISTGKTPMTDDAFVRHMRSIEGNTFGEFIGSTITNDYKTFRTLNIKDDVRDSKYLEIYKKDLLTSDPTLDSSEVDRWLDKYKGMKIADGQGYVTLDFYRQFLKSINNWSDAQEMGYQVELAKYRLANKEFNQDYTNEMRERDREFLRANPQNFSFYPPLKIQYKGPIKAVGTYADVMDKFSVVPMLPSMLQDTPLEKLNNEMLKAGISYAKYTSGTKKYIHPPITIYNEDGFSGVDLSKHEPAVHFLDYLKEQINTNPKIKEESIFGSQIRKLIEANIFSSGTASKIDLDRHERYKSYLKGIADLGKRELFKEIGLVEADGRIRIGDMEKFISTVQEQAELRELNDNIRDYIQLDKDTKKLKYALETSLNRKPIQDLLMGLVDRRLRVQKLSGDQLIQISSSGYQSNDFKYRNATDDEIKKYGTNGLRFYHLNYDENGKPTSIQSAQVKVALIGSFEKLLYKNHPDGKRIRTLERLNALLKDDNWVKENQKSITLVGYRIPTQGHNSMEHLQVAEFLPPHAGSVVIVPAEIVAKSGSDFDIDKLSIFRPSFDDKGELIDDESKEGYSNKIINLFSEILSDPKIFKSLIRPNDTDLVKPETNDVAVAIGKRSAADAKEAKPYSGTQIYRYKSNLRKFETLLSAKRLLSIFAVNNTFTTVMQQAGTLQNLTYGITNGPTRQVKLFLMSPQERIKVIKNNKIDIGNKYSVDGTYKQDYYSQLINATVDAASDDFFGYVNMSYENVNVLCHLINQGVPFDRAIWFLNQPVLLRFYADMRKRPKGVSKDAVKATILGELLGKNYFKESETGKVYLDRKAYNKEINDILNNPKLANLYLSKDTLKKYTVKTRNVDEFLKNDKYRNYNALVLSYFIGLQEQAGLFRDLQKVSSYDTVKVSSPTVAYSLFSTMEQIKANKMFDPEEISKIADKSVIGSFNNRVLVATVGAALMPVAFNPYFMQKSVGLIQKNTQFTNKAAQKKFINNYETQWVEYVVKSLGKIGDYSLPQYSKMLQEGKSSLPRRFNDLISKYPDLKEDYALVNKLRPNFPNTTAIKKSNIEVYRLFENTTDDQNRYIAEFRNLINEDSKKYTPAQNKEIQKFFKDLAILGFVQSGFNKSNISFQDIVPYEQLADIFKAAVDNFTKLIAKDRDLLDKYIIEFQNQFLSNQKSNKQSWRGRDYFESEAISKAIAAKTSKEEQKKSQVNTQSKPQPYENVVQQKQLEAPKQITTDQQEQKILNIDNITIGQIFEIEGKKYQVWDGDANDYIKYGISQQQFDDFTDRDNVIALRDLSNGMIAYMYPGEGFLKDSKGNSWVSTGLIDSPEAQQQLLLPEVKTERQYWPGYEMQESAPEFNKVMGKADFKYAMDQLLKADIGYLQIDLNRDPNNIDWDEEDDWDTLKPENFEHALQIINKFGDSNVLSDENGDRITLDQLGDKLSIITIGDPVRGYTEYKGGLSNLLRSLQRDTIPDEDLDQVEKILADYGLLKYRDYNPNQLRLPFSDEDYQRMLDDCKPK